MMFCVLQFRNMNLSIWVYIQSMYFEFQIFALKSQPDTLALNHTVTIMNFASKTGLSKFHIYSIVKSSFLTRYMFEIFTKPIICINLVEFFPMMFCMPVSF